MNKVRTFLRRWVLPIGMALGAVMYLGYRQMDFLHPAGPVFLKIISIAQPAMLFFMLFLTFCKVEPKELKPTKWGWRLLLIQGGSFAAMGLLMFLLPDFEGKVIIESAMLCMICPTATAAAVVTDKLGGEMPGLITYTILINLATAVLVPLFVPLAHPMEGMSFIKAFLLILSKVFPLLICPALLAWAVRYFMPRLHRWIVQFKDLAFYVWAVSLTVAILMTARAICQSDASMLVMGGIAAASLVCCAFQFWAGKKIGAKYGDKITAGQALGQKNTVFCIWMGYTFMDPVTSVAGGFYSIWHNCFNSWQLYRVEKGKTI